MNLFRNIRLSARGYYFTSGIDATGKLDRFLYFRCLPFDRLYIDSKLFYAPISLTIRSSLQDEDATKVDYVPFEWSNTESADLRGSFIYVPAFEDKAEAKKYEHSIQILLNVEQTFFEEIFSLRDLLTFFAIGVVGQIRLTEDDGYYMDHHSAYAWDGNPMKIISYSYGIQTKQETNEDREETE